jgi:hypothetical protein
MKIVTMRPVATVALLLASSIVPVAAQQSPAPPPTRPNVIPPLTLTIAAFTDGGTIPLK